MIKKDTKCALVIDEALPIGVLVNTATILGATLGRMADDFVGPDVLDGSGQIHQGIVTLPIPVLKGNREILKTLREKLYTTEFEDLTVVDFSDVAQGCHIYEDYIQKAETTQEKDFTYLGVLLYGNKKKINKLTGSMPLLR
jgi:hypothetical protein